VEVEAIRLPQNAIFIHTFTYKYIYIYTYTHTYLHIYIYTFINDLQIAV
jgi:hypothetical protein